MLALLGGAAASSLMGCDRDPPEESTEVVPDEERIRSTSSPTATVTAGGPSPDESAGAIGSVTRRFPATGYRSLALSPWETVIYAVTVEHPDARFGDFADQNAARLLGAADAGIRIVPPHQWRNAAERAKTEAAIRDQLMAILSKEAKLTGPASAVTLDVQDITHRRRRTAGIPPRNLP